MWANTELPGRGRHESRAGSSLLSTLQRRGSLSVLAILAALTVGLAGCTGTAESDNVGGESQLNASVSSGAPMDDVEAPADGEAPSAAPSKTSAESGAEKTKKSAEPKESKDSDKPSKSGSPGVAPDARLAELKQPVADAVPLEKKAKTESFDVSVQKVTAIQGEGKGIGEVAGPAIRFVVSVRNTSDKALRLDSAVVTVDYGSDAIPAIQLSQSGAKEFPATVKPGKSSSGTFVFQVPNEERGAVRILFNHSAGERIVAFEGSIPTGKK